MRAIAVPPSSKSLRGLDLKRQLQLAHVASLEPESKKSKVAPSSLDEQPSARLQSYPVDTPAVSPMNAAFAEQTKLAFAAPSEEVDNTLSLCGFPLRYDYPLDDVLAF